MWRQLNKFVIRLDQKENLTWEDKTALFGAYLVDKGIQSSTLKSYFSAIKFVLKQDGYQWDDSKVLLSSLVRSCKFENDKLRIRLPIQKGFLELLLFEVQRMFCGEDKHNQQPYLETMYICLFTLAYYGMLRVGELTESPHVLKAGNIHVAHNKDKIMIVLYSSKTHGEENKPQKIRISAVQPQRNNRFFCPFRAALSYMNMRGSYDIDAEQFFVFADKSPVKAHQVRSTLRTPITRLDLDESLYDVHSFRIGRTCDLYKFGYSIDQIKSMGRWKSNAVYRYLKN